MTKPLRTPPWDTQSGRVGVAGDWHGSVYWLQQALPYLRRQGLSLVYHLGDFGIWPGREGLDWLRSVEYWAKVTGITLVVTPGNHEDWDDLSRRFAVPPGQPVQAGEHVWLLPRGYRWVHGGRSFLSFGGAASVDYQSRIEGETWWRGELPSEADAGKAIAGGPADVMLTHEAPSLGTDIIDRIRRLNPQGWGEQALAYGRVSERRVNDVVEAIQPALLAHGHYHVPGEAVLGDGRRVYSLGRDGQRGNLAALDLPSLTWQWFEGPKTR